MSFTVHGQQMQKDLPEQNTENITVVQEFCKWTKSVCRPWKTDSTCPHLLSTFHVKGKSFVCCALRAVASAPARIGGHDLTF